MDENKKKQRRVSFASEAPEQNIYEKEVTINSSTTDDITADFTCDQTKVPNSFYDDTNITQDEKSKKDDNCLDNKENDSIMSNNTAVFDELINTQYIRRMVPPVKQVSVNINELLIEQGIRFLDDIVVSSTRRETLSKSKKEVDPKNVIYYKYFLVHRIKFFEDFSEDLKNELSKLSDEISQVEKSFDIKGTLLEKEDKSKLRSLKTDCRSRANVSWYELRAKKELEFNDLVIKHKNELINDVNLKENELISLRNKKNEIDQDILNIETKLNTLHIHDMLNITSSTISKIQQDIVNHEQVLEEYLTEYENLKMDVNNKKIIEESKEKKYLDLKNEISELEKQFRGVSVNENDLNDIKNEYEKLSAILGIEIKEFKKDSVIFNFLNYEIIIKNDEIFGRYLNSKSIIHEYGISLLKHFKKGKDSLIDVCKLLNCLQELYKEILSIKENNLVDVFINNDELHLVINISDILSFRSYKFSLCVKSSMDVLIEKNGEFYNFNLYKDKGCILSHIGVLKNLT
jgi:hypothetical protein